MLLYLRHLFLCFQKAASKPLVLARVAGTCRPQLSLRPPTREAPPSNPPGSQSYTPPAPLHFSKSAATRSLLLVPGTMSRFWDIRSLSPAGVWVPIHLVLQQRGSATRRRASQPARPRGVLQAFGGQPRWGPCWGPLACRKRSEGGCESAEVAVLWGLSELKAAAACSRRVTAGGPHRSAAPGGSGPSERSGDSLLRDGGRAGVPRTGWAVRGGSLAEGSARQRRHWHAPCPPLVFFVSRKGGDAQCLSELREGLVCSIVRAAAGSSP